VSPRDIASHQGAIRVERAWVFYQVAVMSSLDGSSAATVKAAAVTVVLPQPRKQPFLSDMMP